MSKQCCECDNQNADELLQCHDCLDYYCTNCNEDDELFFKCYVCGTVTCESCDGCVYCDNHCGEDGKMMYICSEHTTKLEDIEKNYCPKEECQKVYQKLLDEDE